MNETNKFLTVAMGECWHDVYRFPECLDCGAMFVGGRDNYRTNFSTPDGFFKLWNWAQTQEWWKLFKLTYMDDDHWVNYGWVHGSEFFINPERFATAVYEFLKESKPND